MYKYFTAIIHDTGKVTDYLFRTLYDDAGIIPWASANAGEYDVVYRPEQRGIFFNSCVAGHDTYRDVRPSSTHGDYWSRKAVPTTTGTIKEMIAYHDKPLMQSLNTDFYNPTDGAIPREVIFAEHNVDMGGYYMSRTVHQVTGVCSTGWTRSIVMVTPVQVAETMNVWGLKENVYIRDENGDPYSPDKIYLATKEGIREENQECLPYLDIRGTANRGTDPSQSSASAGYMDMYIKNKNFEISQLLYNRMESTESMFWNEKIEIFGYTSSGERRRIHTASIKDLESDPFEMEYKVVLSDVFDRMKLSAFERELREYTFGLGSDDDLSQDQVTQTRLPLDYGFTFTRDTVGPEAVRKVLFSGHPIDCVFGMLQIMFSRPLAEIGVQWLAGDWVDFVDMEAFGRIRENDLADPYYDQFSFEWSEPIDDPFDWIKDQIFKPCRIFPYIDNEGRLSIKTQEQPQAVEGVLNLDENRIISIPRKKNSIDNYVNHVSVEYDRDWAEVSDYDYLKKKYRVDGPAVKRTKSMSPQREPLQFFVDGINALSDTDQNTLTNQIVAQYLNRYATALVEIDIEAHVNSLDWEPHVGEYVQLTHKRLIDWYGDNLGKAGLPADDVDPDEDPTFDETTVWAGWYPNNDLGRSLDGTTVIHTNTEQVQSGMFNGASESVASTLSKLETWLAKQEA
jgi:hypothetical protein